jgi:hypothetical protein
MRGRDVDAEPTLLEILQDHADRMTDEQIGACADFLIYRLNDRFRKAMQ